ncbi:MAG: DNA oxidative demethylase AlkB [Gammaproteobacteria bacterium]|nr:DNA oxidative demethylase AlkB [Gammaproteobacteria bacterium]
MPDLLDDLPVDDREPLAEGAWLLRGFAREQAPALLAGIDEAVSAAPFRHLLTPGGRSMSVAMSNCGARGWVSDRRGYRYEACDPVSGVPWPPMPTALRAVAREAAQAAGYPGFEPDACLINQYLPGARMALHQDRDETDFAAPIVSVSLGLPAIFLFGGLARADKPQRRRLVHADVVVWGGASRLVFHGVAPLARGEHPLTGPQRLNLTFRKTR